MASTLFYSLLIFAASRLRSVQVRRFTELLVWPWCELQHVWWQPRGFTDGATVLRLLWMDPTTPEENGSSLYSTFYSTLRHACSCLWDESCASSDSWPIGRLASAATCAPCSKTLCTLAGMQYQGYSATMRPAVSLTCLSQASIFTVWPLDNVCSVTAHLLISISQNPLIQAECEGSLTFWQRSFTFKF